MEQAMMCPQCNAPLTPHPFARSAVCSYCGATVRFDDTSAVQAARFHDAFRQWNSPLNHNVSAWFSVGDRHWVLNRLIASGEVSDVYDGQRARWPTELVIIKLLRDPQNSSRFENEWASLQKLHKSGAVGGETFKRMLPQLVLHGVVSEGQTVGSKVSIFRRERGFRHTVEKVLQVYPQGIPPQASIWVWRRILEILSFIHASGMVHGAVLPSHLLIQDNEHGIRLVGYGRAGLAGEKLNAVPALSEAYYPDGVPSANTLTPQLDLSMSARCIASLLGGDAAAAALPKDVPDPLAEVVSRVARADPGIESGQDAWSIREELGRIADEIFGPPKFIPITLPD